MSPRLILLPGMDGTGNLFNPLLQVINGKRSTDVVRYPSTKDLNYDQLTELVREKLPHSGPFILLAESFSGPIAFRIAVEKPNGLVGLILVATFFQNPAPVLSLVPTVLWKKISLAPDWAIQRLLLGRGAPKNLILEVLNCIRGMSAEVLTSRVQAIIHEQKISEQPKIEIPTLYLRGNEDFLISRKAATIVSKTCRQFKLAEITGPHLLLQKEPQRAWDVIDHFIENRFDG